MTADHSGPPTTMRWGFVYVHLDGGRRCEGLNRKQQPCRHHPMIGSHFCPHHAPADDPAMVEVQRANSDARSAAEASVCTVPEADDDRS